MSIMRHDTVALLLWTQFYVLPYVLVKFGESPCSSLMVLCTRGVHTGGEETLMPPLGRVESSEEVLTRICTVSIGGMIPRLTTNTVLSKSSSITMCPVTPDMYATSLAELNMKFCSDWQQTVAKIILRSFNFTTPALENSIRCAAVIQITVLNFSLVFDLQRYNLTGYHRLKPHDNGVFLQWINEEP